MAAFEDGDRAAVVLLQGQYRCIGIKFRKVEDVADGRRAEGIDRLGVVADHGQPPALRREQLEDFGLQGVGVLVLVDQHALELPADGRSGLGIGQQGPPVEQQVVVIEDRVGLLVVHIAVQQAPQLLFPLPAPREMGLENVGELFPGADATAVDRHARALLREAAVGLRQPQFGADDVQQVLGVAAVVDGELRRQADRLAIAAEQPRGDGMKRAAPHFFHIACKWLHIACRRPHIACKRLDRRAVRQMPQQIVHAAKHFRGGAAGERQEEDLARIDAFGDQPCHALDERRGFARAGPRDDQQRAVAVGGGLALLRIQPAQNSFDRFRRRHVLPHRAHYPPLAAGWQGRTAAGIDNRADAG